MRQGNVYFLQVIPCGPVKIGWTTGLVSYRMRCLQQASPYELKWLGARPGPRTAETAAHHALRIHRLRGEWFHPTPEVMAFVTEAIGGGFEAQAYLDQHFRPKLQERFRKLTVHRRDGLADRIFGMARLSAWHGYKWRNSQILLPEKTLDALESAVTAAERGELSTSQAAA